MDLVLDIDKIGAFFEVPIKILNRGATAIPDDFSENKYTMFTDETGEAKKYRFLQMHFHTPSEHTINGKSYDAEIHFVHIWGDDDLLAIGVFFDIDEGQAGNSWLLEDF